MLLVVPGLGRVVGTPFAALDLAGDSVERDGEPAVVGGVVAAVQATNKKRTAVVAKR
jgi:hypothetical protein